MAIFPGSAIPSAVSDDYEIDNSLRFDDGDSAFLYENIGSAGSSDLIWTLSLWCKRGNITNYHRIGACKYTSGAGPGIASVNLEMGFKDSDVFEFRYFDDTDTNYGIETEAVFRDPSAWYHITLVFNVPDSTAADRMQIWVNGVRQSVTTIGSGYPPNDKSSGFCSNAFTRMVGGSIDNVSTPTVQYPYDGYIAEVYCIDGTAYTASDFGELDSDTNQWKPLDSDDVKDAVTFGTNGFYQKYNSTELADSFADSSDPTTWTAPAGVTSVDYLVVAGGGGGGSSVTGATGTGYNAGGGGGAGGMLTGTLTVVPGTAYTVTVGSGGTAGSASNGGDGGDSVFASITATGGGGGGRGGSAGRAGGSSGGSGSAGGTPGSATAGQGNTGGSSSAWGGGGGGGASANGTNGDTGTNSYGGPGGAGTASSITGSSVTYSGGGGGGSTSGYNASGGSGGGGTGGSYNNTDATAGTANTGGGGGGAGGVDASTALNGGAGGSGIVVIDDGTTVTSFTSSRSSHTITANGDATNQRPQPHDVTANGDAHLIGNKVGTSAAFDDSGDYLSVADSTDFDFGTGDFTLEGFINMSAPHATTDKTFMTIAGLQVYYDGTSSTNQMSVHDDAASSHILGSGGAWNGNTWYHLAIVRSSGTIAIFQDGVQLASTSDTATHNNSSTVYIGEYDGGGSYNWIGYMGLVRVSNSARYTLGEDFTPPTSVFVNDSNTKLLFQNGTDGSQTFDDLSTGDHTIAVNGDVRWFAPKIGAGAMAFDGTTDYLKASSHGKELGLTSDAWTVECWWRTNDITDTYQGIMSGSAPVGTDGDGNWGVIFNYTHADTSNKVGLWLGQGASAGWNIADSLGGSVTSFANNTWYHMALTYDGSTYTLWHNGVSQLTVSSSSQVGGALTTPSINIGAWGSNGNTFNGYIDGVRVTNGTCRYTGSFTPPTTAFTDSINDVLIVDADVNEGTWAEDTSTGLAISTDSRMKFDGTGDYLSVPAPGTSFPVGTTWTLEGWFYFNTSMTTSATNLEMGSLDVTGSNDKQTNKFCVQSNGSNYGSIRFISGLDSGYNANEYFQTTGTSPLSTGVWHHIAVGQNSGTAFIYVDGVAQSVTTVGSPTFRSVTNTSANYQIGAAGGSYAMNAYLDEFRISDSARYTGAFTPQTRGNPFTADANTKLLIHSDYTGGLGADSSGNYNNFTATNLVATDQMIDTPTNNFCTVNPIDNYYASASLSEGNLKVGCDTSNTTFVTSTFAQSSGKWYCEIEFDSPPTNAAVGISAPSPSSSTNALGGGAYAWGYQGDGLIFNDGYTSSYGNSYTTSDIVGIALDLDNNKLYFSKNGTWQNSGDPTSGATGTGAISITDPAATNRGQYYICFGDDNSGDDPRGIFNFGQDSSFAGNKTAQGNQDGNSKGDFYYEPPSGYLALCTDNLSTPEIKLPGEHFNTVLYTGNTPSSQAVTGVGFQPEFLWLKSRSAATGNIVQDVVRGATKRLETNSTGQEVTDATYVASFDSDGFTVGTNTDTNASGGTFVAWNWKAGGAPTADNSAGAGATPTAGSVKIDGANLGSALAGTIPATRLSANTTAGFSIIKYTGDGNGDATFAHGLSTSPDMIIIKNLDDTKGWLVWTPDLGSSGGDCTYLLSLEGTGGAGNWCEDTIRLNGTTKVQIASSSGGSTFAWVNQTGVDYISYCFNSIEGYSKIFSFTGNNNADGPFLYTGFKPAVVIGKCIGASGGWEIIDNARNTYNVAGASLYPNTNAAESVSTTTGLDFLSNGIKVRTTSGSYNQSDTMLAIVFAESPFKYSNAR